MKRITLTGLILLLGVTLFAACSGSDSTRPVGGDKVVSEPPPGLIKATWITPQMSGEIGSIKLQEVEQNWNTHFGLGDAYDNMNFMAYLYDGQLHVRANVCPPCRSVGFSLDGNELVCDRCGTRFNAETGAGISGACKNYPKAAVTYEIADGQVVMPINELAQAYSDTTVAGLP